MRRTVVPESVRNLFLGWLIARILLRIAVMSIVYLTLYLCSMNVFLCSVNNENHDVYY